MPRKPLRHVRAVTDTLMARSIAVTLGSGLRDGAYWPYTSTSPWNMPIGSGATYTTEASPTWPANSVNINTTSFSQPVYVATNSDPFRNVWNASLPTPAIIYTVRVPDSAARSGGSDGHMNVVAPDHRSAIAMFDAVKRGDLDWNAHYPQQSDLTGPGLDAGLRAFGGSQMAGLIRQGEITNGIPHALMITAHRSAMNKNPLPYVWPATQADSGWETTYGTTGNLHMGSLLAIPPATDITTLGLTAGGLVLARAMQDYGVYILDASPEDAADAFNADHLCETEIANSGARTNATSLVGLLQVVTNNTSSTVGGGGTPRAPLAPAAFI